MRIVVVGGGVVGASAAYHLARDGADVVLVDRADRGQASAAGAGIVGPWLARTGDEEARRFGIAGARYYAEVIPRLEERGEVDLGYARVGGLYLSPDLDDLAALARERAVTEPAMGTVSVLDDAAARALFPPLAPDSPGVHIEGTARVDGRKLRDALRRSAVAHGAEERSGTAELSTAAGRTRVTVNGRALESDRIVIAAGAWSRELCKPLGVDLPVAPQRGQIAHFAVPDAVTDDWPVVQPLSSHYMLSFPGGRVVAGATREPEAGFDYRITASGVAEVLEQALRVAPGLADATLVETRIGFRPSTPDNRPLLGPVADDVLVATGMGPTGLTMGPYAGALVASSLLGQLLDFDVAPYEPLR